MNPLTLPDGRPAWAPDAADALAVYREIFDSDDYTAVAAIARPAPLIVDVGANIGLFSLYAKQSQPDAIIHAFEPIPEIADAFERNVQAWDLPAVTLHRVAVGAQTGRMEFTYYPHQPADSTRYPNDKDGQRAYVRANKGAAAADWLFECRAVAVEATTLSTLHGRVLPPGRIDLLKVDVEGSELDVLRGMGSALWGQIDRIVLEVLDTGDRLDEVCRLLADHEFRFQVAAASELPYEFGLSMVSAVAVGVAT